MQVNETTKTEQGYRLRAVVRTRESKRLRLLAMCTSQSSSFAIRETLYVFEQVVKSLRSLLWRVVALWSCAVAPTRQRECPPFHSRSLGFAVERTHTTSDVTMRTMA